MVVPKQPVVAILLCNLVCSAPVVTVGTSRERVWDKADRECNGVRDEQGPARASRLLIHVKARYMPKAISRERTDVERRICGAGIVIKAAALGAKQYRRIFISKSLGLYSLDSLCSVRGKGSDA